MIEKVNPLDNTYFTYDELFLGVFIDYLSKVEKGSSQFVGEKTINEKVSEYTLQYLKQSGEYRSQFELCLKMFDGKTKEEFTKDFIESVKVLFEKYVEDLVKDIIQFAKENINTKKQVDLDFNGVSVNNGTLKQLLHDKFSEYGSKVLLNHRQPYKCRIARISFSSPTTRKKMKGKLRKLGKYAVIDEAIDFIKIRMGLFGEFKYKNLVDSLDDLAADFLINSSTSKIKTSKAKLSTKKLIKEAVNKYEVYNSPKYLIDQNTFQEALRKKIESTLKR